MIQFVNNYEDLSTDKGFQFKFYCDKCGNGFMSRFQPSMLGMAGSFLNAASNLLGWGHSAGNSAYEVQRAVGGSAHDTALKTAVEEGKQHFHQCSRCGKWACPEVCWNAKANQCEECAPDFDEEMASSQAQAKAEAARQQLFEKAEAIDYVSGVDMSARAQFSSPHAVKPSQKASASSSCYSCGHAHTARFCPECGTPARAAKPTCGNCGSQPETPTKFCPDCGSKMS
jgi:membrane protease subunit (stomatin/prohibitin family)